MYQLKLCFVALLWASRCSSWGLFSGGLAESRINQDTTHKFECQDGDLTDQLNEVVMSSDHKRALTKLVELQGKPTCSRRAASRLMVSCASLNGIKDETSRYRDDLELEDIRNAYAVSLAICQFDQAGVDTPESCLAFRSSVVGQNSRGSMAQKPRSEKEQLRACLNSLFLDGSAWTTYTENHQSARIICEASRVRTERDKMIEVYKRRADVDSSRATHYSEALNNFVKSFDIAKSKVAIDLEQLHNDSRSFFDSLQDRLSEYTADWMHKLGIQFSEASVAAETLIHNVVQGEFEIVTAQREALEVSHDIALSARDSQDSAAALQDVLRQVVDVVKDLQIQVAEIREHNLAIDKQSHGIVLHIQNITNQLHSVNALQEENIERAQYMAQIQAEAADSARYWSSWIRFLGVPTWKEVVTNDFRIVGMRWQVLFGSLASSLLGGNYGLQKTVTTNFMLLGGGFAASAIITISEKAFRMLVSTPELSESSRDYDQLTTISIRTTPIDTSLSSNPTPSEPTGRHPHGEVR